MKFRYAWAGGAKQLKLFLDWMGAACDGDKPMIFGEVTTYPGTTAQDGHILLSPTTKYICRGEVRNLVDDLLANKIGQPILCFNMHILQQQDNLIMLF